jgi:hypothetical protein
MLLHQFSDPDNTIVVTVTNPPNPQGQFVPPPYDTLEQDLTPIEIFLTTVKPKNFIWGMDANSKHSLWHSPTTDTRGRMLVDFLSLHGLLTVNEKDGPSYSGPTGDSWIDITVTSIDLAHKIQNWRVSEECTLSDQNLILFNLRTLNHKNHSKRTTDHTTRKCATQVGTWNLFQQKVFQSGQQ